MVHRELQTIIGQNYIRGDYAYIQHSIKVMFKAKCVIVGINQNTSKWTLDRLKYEKIMKPAAGRLELECKQPIKQGLGVWRAPGWGCCWQDLFLNRKDEGLEEALPSVTGRWGKFIASAEHWTKCMERWTMNDPHFVTVSWDRKWEVSAGGIMETKFICSPYWEGISLLNSDIQHCKKFHLFQITTTRQTPTMSSERRESWPLRQEVGDLFGRNSAGSRVGGMSMVSGSWNKK